MNRNNFVLRAAVASAFGVVAAQAGAAVDFGATTVTPARFAKEIPTNTTAIANAGNALDMQIKVPAGYVPSASTDLYVKVNLTNGATFGGTPSIYCATAGDSATYNDISGDLTLGGASTSFATFLVSANGNTVGTYCVVTAFTGIGVISGNSRDVSMSATIEYKNGLSNTVSGASNNYITFVRGIGASFSGASGSVVVDATSGSDNFASAGSTSVTNSATKANLGFITVGSVGSGAAAVTALLNSSTALQANGTNNVTGADAIQSATITVSGPALAAGLAALGTSGVYLSLSADAACATKTYKASATATNSVTFSAVTIAHVFDGVHVCMDVSGGTTQITTGQITATIDGSAVSNVTADLTGSTSSLELVSQNGTTKNAYFVNASTSTSKTSVIRIVNTGGNSGTIRATAYVVGSGTTPSSTAAGTANATIATLAANESITLTSADLESLLGYTPSSSTEKYRVVFSAGLAAFKVLNYTKDVAGGYITLSQSQDD